MFCPGLLPLTWPAVKLLVLCPPASVCLLTSTSQLPPAADEGTGSEECFLSLLLPLLHRHPGYRGETPPRFKERRAAC
ncbi:hypothetical protein NQZ68_033493 [Dissostichus eleginoides]|nr:hypothetical protein NQZ68_033493 [Dissostichus eleginoides]